MLQNTDYHWDRARFAWHLLIAVTVVFQLLMVLLRSLFKTLKMTHLATYPYIVLVWWFIAGHAGIAIVHRLMPAKFWVLLTE